MRCYIFTMAKIFLPIFKIKAGKTLKNSSIAKKYLNILLTLLKYKTKGSAAASKPQ